MARARNIKPGFFSNEDLVELDFATRLLFIGLWTEADKEGRLDDRPKRLKMSLFPADSLDVDSMLNGLKSRGFIRRYSVNSLNYIQIVNFKKHQNPHHTEKDSVIPPEQQGEEPDINGEITVKEPILDGEYLADSLIPDSLFTDSPIPDSGNLKPETRKQPTANAAAVEVFAHWQTRMNHPGAKLDAKRSKQITAALKLGYTVEHLKAAIDGCAKSPFHMGNNDRHTVFDSIELIFRSADKIDTFIKLNNTETKPGAGYEQPKSNLDKLIQQYGQQQPEPPPADYIDGEVLDSDGGDLWPTLGPVIRADS
jgi:hypothetical protein